MSSPKRSWPQPTTGWWLLVAGLVFITGCGASERAAVSGTVTLDGAPLDGATIMFIPMGATKGPKAGAKIVNGKYQVPEEEGPPFGDLRVEITKDDENPPPLDDPTVAYKYNGPAPTKNRLPKIYNVESTLSVKTTRDGANEFPFELESKPKGKSK